MNRKQNSYNSHLNLIIHLVSNRSLLRILRLAVEATLYHSRDTMYTSSSFENDRRYNGGRLYSDDVFTCDEKLFATYECIKNLNAEFVVLNNDPSETNSNSGIQKGILINPQAVDDGNEMADTAECTRKKSKTIRSVSFHEEEKKQFDTDLEFGIKSYLHEFYEPIDLLGRNEYLFRSSRRQ